MVSFSLTVNPLEKSPLFSLYVQIIFLTTFIASPLFIIYALSSVILWNFNTVLSDEKTGLAHAVVASVVRYIIMATYLYLWVPPVHRHNKELRRGRPRSPCQS